MVTWLNVAPLSGATFSGQITSRGIQPAVADTYDIGSSSNRYSRVWTGQVQASGNGVIGGNLTVVGTLNVVGGQTISSGTAYTSPTIDVAAASGGGNLTTDDGYDKGMNIHYYSSGASSHAFVGREDATGNFVYKIGASNNTEPAANPFGGSYGGAHFGSLLLTGGNAATAYNNNTGDLQVNGGIGVGGAIYGNTVYDQNNRVLTGLTNGTGVTISGTAPTLTVSIGQSVGTSDNVTFNSVNTAGTVRPSSNGGSALGSTSYYWSDIYVNNLRAPSGGGTVYGSWTLGSGASFQATYADLAERYRSDNLEYTPGTVLVFGGTAEVTISTQMNDRRVAGVVTLDPAYLMNVGIEGVDIALQGRVPCKVIGKITKGDLLVTSGIAGVAMANNDPKMGTIIGKALQDYDSDLVGMIEVAVGRL